MAYDQVAGRQSPTNADATVGKKLDRSKMRVLVLVDCRPGRPTSRPNVGQLLPAKYTHI